MSKFVLATIVDVRKETSDAVSFSISLPEEHRNDFSYVQGQYLTFRALIDGEDIRRSYSICSSPLENELRVAVKKVEDGKFSSWANTHLKPGETIEVMPPMGHFTVAVNPEQKKHYVGYAAGSGITPLMSIIKTVLAVEKESTFTLFYGNKGATSVIFREELEALKNLYLSRFALYHVFSREKTDMQFFNGRLDGEKCAAFSRTLTPVSFVDEYFLCGPAEMIESVKTQLTALGADPKKIHFELFTTPGLSGGQTVRKEIKKEYTGADSEVVVILDGVYTHFRLAAEGENILDAALKSGADAPYACKGAVCCTCKALLKEGKVEMDLNYSLTEEELAQGYILTCQAHPVSEQVVVDFDSQLQR